MEKHPQKKAILIVLIFSLFCLMVLYQTARSQTTEDGSMWEQVITPGFGTRTTAESWHWLNTRDNCTR